MPSIAKADLDALNATRAAAEARAEKIAADAALLRARAGAFDAILAKIERAALGQPLADSPNQWANAGYSPYGDLGRLADAERERIQSDQLRERIVDLECRLAAVRAVAQFARDHKA